MSITDKENSSGENNTGIYFLGMCRKQIKYKYVHQNRHASNVQYGLHG